MSNITWETMFPPCAPFFFRNLADGARWLGFRSP